MPDRPRLRVAAVMLHEGGIVLVRHVKADIAYHLLPGGGVEWGETLADALSREVREETGFSCRIVRPLFVNDSIDPGGERHVVSLTFLAEVTGGEITGHPADPRIAAVEIIPVEALATLDLRPPIAAELADAAEGDFLAPAAYLGALWTPDPGVIDPDNE